MAEFLVITDPPQVSSPALVGEGGRCILPGQWIVPWKDTADSLCLFVKKSIPYVSAVIVCSLSGDWSYR